MSTLFREGQRIINVGLQSFADSIEAAGGKSAQVDWTPPAGGNRAAGWSLAQLLNHPDVERANEKAYTIFLAAQPVLTGIGVAREHLPGMSERMILHAGPPIAWQEMCGPMQGAVIGAILYEGWAADAEAATGWPKAERLPSNRRTTTPRSRPWRGSSARRCRCGWSRTPPAAIARIPT